MSNAMADKVMNAASYIGGIFLRGRRPDPDGVGERNYQFNELLKCKFKKNLEVISIIELFIKWMEYWMKTVYLMGRNKKEMKQYLPVTRLLILALFFFFCINSRRADCQ